MTIKSTAEALRSAQDALRAAVEVLNNRNGCTSSAQRYEDYVAALSGVHRRATPRVDWAAIASEEPLPPPTRTNQKQAAARAAADAYSPSVLDWLLGRAAKKRAALEADVLRAQREDDSLYDESLRQHEEGVALLKEVHDVAQRVLSGDIEAYAKAVDLLRPFGYLKAFSNNLELSVEQDSVCARTEVKDTSFIPNMVITSTKTGTSERNMPAARFNELYQEHVCGTAILAASATMSTLPVSRVLVHVTCHMLDESTGHLTQQTILSVDVPRDTLEKLNLKSLDASSAMKNFRHNMKFTKSGGFSAVKQLDQAS